jgi:hypothetical protein
MAVLVLNGKTHAGNAPHLHGLEEVASLIVRCSSQCGDNTQGFSGQPLHMEWVRETHVLWWLAQLQVP